MPPAAELSVLGGTPDKIKAYFCFSPPSALNKKWRKINDVFKVSPAAWISRSWYLLVFGWYEYDLLMFSVNYLSMPILPHTGVLH